MSSVDFFGRPAVLRLQILCGGLLRVEDTKLRYARFVLELGQTWSMTDLDPCVLMARRRGSRPLIDALVAHGASRHPDIDAVRARILAELRALSHADRCEVFEVADRGDLRMRLLMEDHPADRAAGDPHGAEKAAR